MASLRPPSSPCSSPEHRGPCPSTGSLRLGESEEDPPVREGPSPRTPVGPGVPSPTGLSWPCPRPEGGGSCRVCSWTPRALRAVQGPVGVWMGPGIQDCAGGGHLLRLGQCRGCLELRSQPGVWCGRPPARPREEGGALELTAGFQGTLALAPAGSLGGRAPPTARRQLLSVVLKGTSVPSLLRGPPQPQGRGR